MGLKQRTNGKGSVIFTFRDKRTKQQNLEINSNVREVDKKGYKNDPNNKKTATCVNTLKNSNGYGDGQQKDILSKIGLGGSCVLCGWLQGEEGSTSLCQAAHLHGDAAQENYGVGL